MYSLPSTSQRCDPCAAGRRPADPGTQPACGPAGTAVDAAGDDVLGRQVRGLGAGRDVRSWGVPPWCADQATATSAGDPDRSAANGSRPASRRRARTSAIETAPWSTAASPSTEATRRGGYGTLGAEPPHRAGRTAAEPASVRPPPRTMTSGSRSAADGDDEITEAVPATSAMTRRRDRVAGGCQLERPARASVDGSAAPAPGRGQRVAIAGRDGPPARPVLEAAGRRDTRWRPRRGRRRGPAGRRR